MSNSALIGIDHTKAGFAWSSPTAEIYYKISGGPFQGPFTDLPLLVNWSLTTILPGQLASISLSSDGIGKDSDYQVVRPFDLIVSQVTENTIYLQWDTDDSTNFPYSLLVNGTFIANVTSPYILPIVPDQTYSITAVQYQLNPAVITQVAYITPTAGLTVETDLCDPTQVVINRKADVDDVLVIDGVATDPNPPNPYQITGLDPFTSHTVYQQVTSGNTSQTARIATPTMLATGGVTNTTVSLIIDPQNRGGGNYDIYRNGTYLTNVTGNAYDDTTVTAGSSYQYQFFDQVWSNMLYVTVPTTPSNPLKFGITWFFSP